MKTHFRKVFKSDHLGVADLEDFIEQGSNLIFTIKEVKQEMGVKVAGKKGNFNVAYFVEKIKPLVLNVENSNIVRSFNNESPFVEDWSNTVVKLYIKKNISFGRDIVSGVRIERLQPKVVKPQFNETNFDKAKNANATIEIIEKSYSITDGIKQKYLDYVAKK